MQPPNSARHHPSCPYYSPPPRRVSSTRNVSLSEEQLINRERAAQMTQQALAKDEDQDEFNLKTFAAEEIILMKRVSGIQAYSARVQVTVVPIIQTAINYLNSWESLGCTTGQYFYWFALFYFLAITKLILYELKFKRSTRLYKPPFGRPVLEAEPLGNAYKSCRSVDVVVVWSVLPNQCFNIFHGVRVLMLDVEPGTECTTRLHYFRVLITILIAVHCLEILIYLARLSSWCKSLGDRSSEMARVRSHQPSLEEDANLSIQAIYLMQRQQQIELQQLSSQVNQLQQLPVGIPLNEPGAPAIGEGLNAASGRGSGRQPPKKVVNELIGQFLTVSVENVLFEVLKKEAAAITESKSKSALIKKSSRRLSRRGSKATIGGKEASEVCCQICLVQFEEADQIKDLGCSSQGLRHVFHKQCIQQWFEKKLECPLCRTSFQVNFFSFILSQQEEQKSSPIKKSKKRQRS